MNVIILPHRAARLFLFSTCMLLATFPALVASAAELSRTAAALTAEKLTSEVSDWLASNFDLPTTPERPVIAFVSSLELKELRRQNSLPHDGTNPGADKEADNGNPGEAIALYDNGKRTIFLSDSWTGTSPADQSVLVHEMVHHMQNMGKLAFECFMAREKLAYRAQNRWLNRFGLDLESEFQIDPFTVLMNSACM